MQRGQPGPLERAVPLVHGERQGEYGHPADDFARTAAMWHALFGWDVRPEDVPLAMILVKLSRLQQTPRHEDSQTDIAGYIETYAMTLARADAQGPGAASAGSLKDDETNGRGAAKRAVGARAPGTGEAETEDGG